MEGEEEEIALISDHDDKIEMPSNITFNEKPKDPNIIYELDQLFDAFDNSHINTKRISIKLIAGLTAYSCLCMCLCLSVCGIFIIVFLLSISTLIK